MPPFPGQIPPGLAGLIGGGAGGPPQAGVAPGGGQPLPPSLMAAPPGVGPMSTPQGNPGNSLAAMAKVKTALTLLQEALPAIPLGSEAHTDILKTVSTLAKHVPEQGTGDQQQIGQLMAVIQKLVQQKPNAALAGMAPPPNASPALPPSPMPPPGAGTAPPGAGMAA